MITQTEISLHAAESLVKSDDSSFQDETKTASQIMMLFAGVGKFVSFMFRKTHYETVIADIFGFGNFIRNCTIGKIGVTHFYPTIALQS